MNGFVIKLALTVEGQFPKLYYGGKSMAKVAGAPILHSAYVAWAFLFGPSQFKSVA